jgi:hypothetical protein
MDGKECSLKIAPRELKAGEKKVGIVDYYPLFFKFRKEVETIKDALRWHQLNERISSRGCSSLTADFEAIVALIPATMKGTTAQSNARVVGRMVEAVMAISRNSLRSVEEGEVSMDVRNILVAACRELRDIFVIEIDE